MAVEIDEAELKGYQEAYKLLRKLQDDPKSRPAFEKAVKTHFPQVETTEERAEALAKPYVTRIEEQLSKLSETVEGRFKSEDERAAKLREETQLADMESSFGRLRERGYTDDGIEKIKGLMVGRKIADPEAAAALFDRQNPPPAEAAASWEPARWNLDENAVADTKALFDDPERWADREVASVLNDIRKAA